MIVGADEVGRSLRGTADFLNRRPEGLAAFDVSEAGFRRSFGAIALTLPALVAGLALERWRLGMAPGRLLDPDGVALALGLGDVALFLAVPLAMIPLARRLGWDRAYVPFVVATNWWLAVALDVLALPAGLLVLGLATPALAVLYAAAFAVVLARVHWFAARVTLGLGSAGALALTLGAAVLLALVAGAVLQIAAALA